MRPSGILLSVITAILTTAASAEAGDSLQIGTDGRITFGGTITAPYLLASAVPVGKNDTFTASQGNLYLISGTDHDFDINLPNAATAGAGAVVACVVAPISAASRQYTLRPSSGELLDGRASLILVHTNTVYLMSDGVAWRTVIKKVDTDYVVAVGGVPFSATVTNPTKPTSPTVDVMRWRRSGDCIQVQYFYRQTSSGTGGSGVYLIGLPPGIQADLNKIPAINSVANTTGRVGSGAVIAMDGASTPGRDEAVLTAYMYDATHVGMWMVSQAISAEYPVGATASYYKLGVTTLKFTAEVMVPVQGW